MARILTDETSLHRRRDSLRKGARQLQSLVRYELGGAVVLLAAGALAFKWWGPGLLVVGVLASFFAAGHWLKIKESKAEEDSASAGLQGEQNVTRILRDGLPNDSYILNDITLRRGLRSAQMDHVVVSPRGIFVVETKNWRGMISGDEQEAQWTQVKRPGEKPMQRANPILQNRRQIQVMQAVLKAGEIDWPDIFPVLISNSRNAQFDIRNRSVPILTRFDAVEYMAGQVPGRQYTESEVTAVIELLMKKAR